MRLRVWRIGTIHGCPGTWFRADVRYRGRWFTEYANTRRDASWYAVQAAHAAFTQGG